MTVDHGFGITGFIRTSFLDWPGKICSVIFLAGCNFRCPACHNAALVAQSDTRPEYPIDEIVRYLEKRKGWIDGVAVTGGEPTIRKNLPELLRLLRQTGTKIKLDTNGYNPAMLSHVISSQLIDAVAMDVKAPLTSTEYSRVTGTPLNIRLIKRSIEIIKESKLETTFRTTVIPHLVEERQLSEIRNFLGKVKNYKVQSFRNEETLDPSFSGLEEFSLERVEKMRRDFEIPSLDIGLDERACAG
ncbi:MAG TPA: anaerobic ribonucleoside-triphosphate reductase activating protein [Desulfomonilaceae bacterium]|nr:anaerobic ribonucleoside-triphosphate reductase activating protein [Desulfomonilaceae bacterium]